MMGLASCLDNAEREPAQTCSATYYISFGDDFFKAATATVYFKDGDKTKSIVFDDGNVLDDGKMWKRTTRGTLNAPYGFRIVIHPKSVNELSQDSYDLHTTGKIDMVASTGNKFHGSWQPIVEAAGPVGKSQTPSVLLASSGKVIAYQVDSKGDFVENTTLFD